MQHISEIRIPAAAFRLPASIQIPRAPRGIVLLVHGAGAARHRYMARALGAAGFATLLVDLLDEYEAHDRHNALDVDLQAERLVQVTRWAQQQPRLLGLRTGYFGSDIGSGVALIAAAHVADRVQAVVCRGGRPDTAFDALRWVQAPTLFIADGSGGEPDWVSIACKRCEAPKELVSLPGASSAQPAADVDKAVANYATGWFQRYVASGATASAAAA